MDEEVWRDRRTDELEARRKVIMSGGYVWPSEAPSRRVREDTQGLRIDHPADVPPRRIDWWRVSALLIVAGATVLTFLGFYVLLVYVLTAL